MRVKKWISYAEGREYPTAIGGWGGWFEDGMRWADFLAEFDDEAHPYMEAMRQAILEKKIRKGGSWHQDEGEQGMPLFDDNTVGSFTFRAWGDLLAAVWSEAENKNYNYVSFAFSGVESPEDEA